jgi:hypothetical protein
LANLILIIACALYFLSKRKAIIPYFKTKIQYSGHYPLIVRILIFIYFLLLLFFALLYPTISDTGLYHAQNIQWIANFKIVPGLGNLHGRFAFNNHSFLEEALFSFSFLKQGNFHLLNSYLLFILSATLILSVWKTTASNPARSLLYAGLLILIQVFYLKSVSSPTPDIFTLAGICFIFITYFERISSAGENKFYWIPVLLVAFFLVTVKLSAFPVALIALLFLLDSDYSLRGKILWITFLGIVVFIPFFVRNYFLSGYLVYPYPSIDFFNPDWKIPSAFVNEMKSVIMNHARTRTWQQMPFNIWLPIWFSRLSTGFKFLSYCLLVSPLLTAAILFISKQVSSSCRKELEILVICFIAIVFWFFSAPNFRFIYPFLFFYVLLTVIILIRFLCLRLSRLGFSGKWKEKFSTFHFSKFLYVLLIIFPAWFLLKFNFREIKRCLIFPAGYRNVPVKTIQINNLRVNIPSDSTYCWNSPLPCSVFQKDIGITNIEMRGKELKDGFRVRKK